LFKFLPRFPVWLSYMLLFATLAALYVVPTRDLFLESAVTRAFVATFALCLPVFFAGVIFIASFARVNFQGSALGSNLFGALVGGLLESLSLWFGLRSLAIMAGMLYVASAATFTWRSRARDAASEPLEVVGTSGQPF
jgi:hypothetical protein